MLADTPEYLPRANEAFIDPAKITRYLLALGHPKGRSNAAFFMSIGFQLADWEALRDALLRHGLSNRVAFVQRTRFGMLYSVEGEMPSPDGRMPTVRSVWVILSEPAPPRFVTAYPL